MTDTIPALTILQPWAHLIVTPDRELPRGVMPKWVENRSWATWHRGPLAIHAGGSTRCLRPGHRQQFPEMQFGAVVGIAELIDCVPMFPGDQQPVIVSDENRKRYPWLEQHVHATGPIGWILGNVRRLATPVPCRGRQRLWKWEPPAGLKLEQTD